MNNGIEFYYLILRSSHLGYPRTIQGSIIQLLDYTKKITDYKDSYSKYKFIIKDFEITYDFDKMPIVFINNNSNEIQLNHIHKITTKLGNIFYTQLSRGWQDHDCQTIPVNIVESGELFLNIKGFGENNIINKINELDDDKKENILRILNVFNICIYEDCDDGTFYTHEHAKLLKDLLKEFGLDF
jgi:hypothetical protein